MVYFGMTLVSCVPLWFTICPPSAKEKVAEKKRQVVPSKQAPVESRRPLISQGPQLQTSPDPLTPMSGRQVPLSPPIPGETSSTLPPPPSPSPSCQISSLPPHTNTLSQPPDPTISPTATPYCVPILHLHRLLGLIDDISDQQSTASRPSRPYPAHPTT